MWYRLPVNEEIAIFLPFLMAFCFILLHFVFVAIHVAIGILVLAFLFTLIWLSLSSVLKGGPLLFMYNFLKKKKDKQCLVNIFLLKNKYQLPPNGYQ